MTPYIGASDSERFLTGCGTSIISMAYESDLRVLAEDFSRNSLRRACFLI
jgi:hypothetical protein